MAPLLQHQYVTRPSKASSLLDARADRIAKRVEWYHELGRDAIKTGQSPREISLLHGLSLSVATKAKDFADNYTRAQLREYLRLRRPDGMPLNWGYVPLLLTLPHGKRSRFQRKIAKEGWLPPEAYRQIKSRFPEYRRQTSGSVGGRPSKYTPGTREHLQSLVELAERLAKGLEQLDRHRARGAHVKSLRATTRWLKSRTVN